MKLTRRNDYLEILINTMNSPDIKVITGVRRAVKSKHLEEFRNYIIKNKNNNDKQFIYDLFADNKYFGEEELRTEEKIIKNNSIPLKNNVMDYYE